MQRNNRIVWLAAGLLGCSSEASSPVDRGEVLFRGAHAAEMAGSALGQRDFNGDGHLDLLIGAPSRDAARAGRAYVVFGPLLEGEHVLDAALGMSVVGKADGQSIASNVQGIGDTSGDGLDDFLVSENITCTVPEGCYEDCPSTCSEGLNRVHLVHGRTEGGELSLDDAVSTPDDASDALRDQLFAALGDLNGDGLSDFAISAASTNEWSGRVYVVFGAADRSSIDLSAIAAGQGGYIIEPEPGGNTGFGRSLAAAEINGDGLTDLVIGAHAADENRGRAYVAFGKADTSPITASDIVAGAGGFAMQAEDNQSEVVCCSETGLSVGAGDINGDGLDDIVVAAPFMDLAGQLHTGRTYVVFGKASGEMVQLSNVATGSGGFSIDGEKFSKIGFSVASFASDLDGDGRADVLLDDADANVFIASGKADGQTIGIANLTRFVPETPGPWYLTEGSSLGLFNANGAADLALSNAQFQGDEAGAVLVILR
jgi:hypothetical protein